MPRNHNTVKAAKPGKAKLKSRVIEWEERSYSRGVRDIPVDVTSMARQRKPRKATKRQPRADNDDTFQGETAPQPMDIDETFWAEEPGISAGEKKVRQPACPP